MSTSKKFYTMIGAMLLLSSTSFAQNLLELPVIQVSRSGAIVGNGFGPRTTNHVVYFDKDRLDNGKFDPQSATPNAIAAPYNAVTFSLQNQQYASGFSYAGNPNPVTTGLVFGAAPDNADGVGPNGVGVQGVTPLNSYDLLGAFGNSGGPRNGMFRSNYTAVPNASPFPTQSGSGIDAEGLLPPGSNDANGGTFLFTCAQRLYELNAVHNSATRHYMGDLVISFTRFMDNPVVHIAGLGGSYRYAPVGTDPSNLANWVSTFFTTELELQDPSGLFTLTKMASNTFMTVSGDNITNNATAPNGESFDIGVPPAGTFNNFGAATGSVRVDGPPVRFLRFRVYMRGSNASQFAWSAPSTASAGGNRNPVTGDIWAVSVSASYCISCIPLPAVGMKLDAALNGNDVMLNWKTESEIDTKEFEIQRSTDAVNYTTIAVKAAAGNSPTAINYAHTDPNMQAPVYYYRLKLVDIDNDVTYSNVAPVRKAGSVKGIRIYPNPAVSQLSVEFSNAKGDYIISLYNQTGQEVLTQKAIVTYGVQSIPVNRNNLPAGTYMMKVRSTTNSDLFNEKVILQ
jgi:hypothetical protein